MLVDRLLALSSSHGLTAVAAISLAIAAAPCRAGELGPFPNATGAATTYFDGAAPERSHPFFSSRGANGRACGDCHVPEDGWSITPASLQRRFDETAGMDPVFRPHDGANAPNADVSTVEARRRAYALLLSRGLIRIERGMPENAEFELVEIRDPYGYATPERLSLYRRPLPSTNLKFRGYVMWDGREPNLAEQARNAVKGHAQGGDVSDADFAAIVDLESRAYSAQVEDALVGDLTTELGTSPPALLAREEPVDADFDLFDPWRQDERAERQAVVRGQHLFNDKATCASCHDGRNAGGGGPRINRNDSSDPENAGPDLPVYVLRNKETGEVMETTDPGYALIDGWWVDVGAFTIPTLRALASHPPYFHNGLAKTLEEVVDFYDRTRILLLTAAEKRDLVAFLRTL